MEAEAGRAELAAQLAGLPAPLLLLPVRRASLHHHSCPYCSPGRSLSASTSTGTPRPRAAAASTSAASVRRPSK